MPLIVSLQQVDVNQFQVIISTGAPFDVMLTVDATTVTIPKGSTKSDTFTAVGIPEIGALPTLPANHFGYMLSKSTVCDRTSQVAEAIAVAVPDVTDCRNVTEIDLTDITALDLNAKSITSLQADDFAGLLSLTTLDLSDNQLSSLPDGIFTGMTSLSSLDLDGNTVDPLPLTISLIKVGEDQIKAVLPTGAPFDIAVPVLIQTGNVATGTVTLTIPQGSDESGLQTITRQAGTIAAVSVNIGTLPSLPAMHSGYALAKSNNLPLEILERINVAPVFADGSSTTRSIAENTDARVNIGSAVAATDANNDTLTYTLSGTTDAPNDYEAFDIVSTSGQLQTKAALDFETKNKYQVTVSVSDGTLTDTINVTINVTDITELQLKDETETVTTKNSAPVFTEGDDPVTRAVAENTGAGVDIGSAVSATDMDKDTLTYSLGGVDAGSFTINTTTGQLRTNAALDYETKDSYTVEITVSDGMDTDTITVMINVTDVDEAPTNVAPTFNEGDDPITRSVAENTGAGVDIGSAVSATDANDDTLTYSLSGTDAASFSIDSSSGQLRTSAALDYEMKTSYSVTITVSDGKGGSDTIVVTINTTNVDEKPENIAPVFSEGDDTTRSIAENTGSGVDIGSAVSATDADNNTLTYTLGGTDAVSFSIDSTTGQLKTSAELDFEDEDTYLVVISVSDGEGSSDSINVTINVTNVNEAPIFIDGDSATRSIAENALPGVNIGTAVAATDDDKDTLTYTLTGTNATSFEIDSATGQLKTKAELDYETPPNTYTVTVSVSDNNGGTDSITVTITVTDLDETPSNNPPVITAGTGPITRAVTENMPAGTNVGAVVAATDADFNTLVYLLSGDDASVFSIDSDGQLKTSAVLNHEVKSSYSVIITVSDGSLTDSIVVNINVTDVNDVPVFSKDVQTTLSIAENTAATNIGNAFTATDEDVDDTLTYSLDEDTDTTLFSIDATGQLRTLKPLDYETATSYRLTITVSDGKGGSDEIEVTISVTDVDENIAPVFTEGDDTTRTVAENTGSGVNIGDPISATDENTDDTLTYSLGGDDAASFSINTSNGQLHTHAALDYEKKDTYSVTITVRDGKGGSDSIDVSINVTDVDENVAPVFTEGDDTTRTVAENTGSGVNIGDPISATDENTDDTLTYSLGGDDAASFSINTSNGQLHTHAALDYEKKDTYSVTITVRDGKGGSDSIDVSISVTDVDENVAPVFTEGDGPITREVPENTAAGENIGTPVAATDTDTSDTLTYTLGGTDAASFDIVSTNGQLQTKAALNFETDNEYTVTVSVSDGKGGSDSITVTINVTDVVENQAPMFTEGDGPITREVPENTAAGENIGTPVAATDTDTSDTLTYTLGGTDAASFDIVSTNGQLQTKAALNFETDNEYTVTVSVSDGKGGSDSITVTINVTDVVENQAPMFATDSLERSILIDSNTVAGNNIGAPITATDADEDILSYSLGGTHATFFSIVSTTGQLQTTAAFLSDTNVTYSITVIADDGNGGTDSVAVTVRAAGRLAPQVVNSAPTFTDGNSTTRSVAENTAAGQNIGTPVTATDTDSSDTLTYTLGGDDAASFSIVSTSGQLQTKAALDYETENEYTVTVSVSDGNGGSDSITVTINITDVNEDSYPLMGRTQQVQDAIVAAIDGVDSAEDVTKAHLQTITSLNLSHKSISSLVSNDFLWLTGLTDLNLSNNNLESLPDGIFTGLSSLTSLNLDNNYGNHFWDTDIIIGVSLKEVADNEFVVNVPTYAPFDMSITFSVTQGSIVGGATTTTISQGVINSAKFTVTRSDSSIPARVSIVSLPSLPSGHVGYDFERSGVHPLVLTLSTDGSDNSITPITDRTQEVQDEILEKVQRIESDVDSIEDVTNEHLAKITERLFLHNKGITSLKDGDFSGMPSLQEIDLSLNELNSLPSGIFDDLPSLMNLLLIGNNLTYEGLPDGVFEGLSSLNVLHLGGHDSTITEFHKTVLKLYLEKVADGQFRAKIRTGAPFDISIPIVLTNGTLASGATSVTISTGSVYSDTLTVTRTAGTTDAVTVKFGEAVPVIPTTIGFRGDLAHHVGYRFTWASRDPVELIAAVNNAPQLAKNTTPVVTTLLANYPNPANPETWIPYQLKKPTDVSITIYNLRGVVVRKLALGHQAAGIYRSRSRAIHWDGKNAFGETVSSGVYFYVFRAGKYAATRKILILK